MRSIVTGSGSSRALRFLGMPWPTNSRDAQREAAKPKKG
jgi:hypothetical protein